MTAGTYYFSSHVTGSVSTPNNANGAPDGTYTTDANSATSWTSRWRLNSPGAGFSASGTQSITLRMRKGSNSGNPTISSVTLYQNGSAIGALTLFSGSTTISSTSGQDLVYQFDGALLTGVEQVDIEVATTAAGGGPSARNAASIDGGTWSINYVAGAQSLTQSSRLDNSNAFYAPTVTTGPVSLAQSSRLDNVNTFYAPTVVPPGQALTQDSRFDNTASFYAPTVTPSYSLAQGSRFDNANDFYAHTVTAATIEVKVYWAVFDTLDVTGQTLSPARFDNGNTFYAPFVEPGSVTLSAEMFDDSADTFYAPTVTPGSVTLSPPRLDNGNVFYAHAITPGAAQIQPSLFENGNGFYQASISLTLLPDLFANDNAFYEPAVSPGTVTLLPGFLVSINTFYEHTLSGGISSASENGMTVSRFRARR